MSRYNLSAWAVNHRPLVLFLILLLGVGGLLSYLRLGRAEDPSFTLKVANVTATWPGATAEEMQNQVADPIEKKAQDLPYFDHVQTYAKPSFLAMQVFFKDTTPPREVPWLFYLLRKKLTDARGDLPAGLIGPEINDEFGDVDSVLYMVSGEGADYGQLKKVVESMRQRLLAVPDVVKVNLYGVQDPRIFVEFSQAQIGNLGLSPQTILEFAVAAERCRRQRRVRDPGRPHASAHFGRDERRGGGRRDAGRIRRARVPAWRCRQSDPRLQGPVGFPHPPARQGGRGRRRRHGEGRQSADVGQESSKRQCSRSARKFPSGSISSRSRTSRKWSNTPSASSPALSWRLWRSCCSSA